MQLQFMYRSGVLYVDFIQSGVCRKYSFTVKFTAIWNVIVLILLYSEVYNNIFNAAWLQLASWFDPVVRVKLPNV